MTEAGRPLWLSTAEVGSLWCMRFTAWAYRSARGPAVLLLRLIAGYFWLRNREGRRVSRDYFRRLTGRDPGPWHSYRHFFDFALTTAERLDLWAGALDGYQITCRGEERLAALAASGRGAVLLGAHVGGFDVLRVMSRRQNIKVNVLMHRGNSRMVSSVFRSLFPHSDTRLIDHDPASPEAVFEMQKCIERGEFVALLGDRSGAGEGDRTGRVSRVPFLGAPAAFPEGPLLLAGLLDCPVLFVAGLRTGPRTYELCAEAFAERVVLPRKERKAALAAYLTDYAARIEACCRRAPTQWFNFFDFWRST